MRRLQGAVAPIKAKIEALETVAEPESTRNEKQLGEAERSAWRRPES